MGFFRGAGGRIAVQHAGPVAGMHTRRAGTDRIAECMLA